MYEASDFTKPMYRVSEVADILGVSTKTIRRWDSEGKLCTKRTEGNQRIIMREDLIKYLINKKMYYQPIDTERRDIIYARVSSNDQKKNGDLDRQALFLVENVKDLKAPMILKEVGSGLNDKRKNIQKLIKMVCNNEVRNIYVTYRDRLTRFGFNYLQSLCEAHGTNIIVVKDIGALKSVEDELTEDIMALMASFSGKLYGMCSRNKKISKTEAESNLIKGE